MSIDNPIPNCQFQWPCFYFTFIFCFCVYVLFSLMLFIFYVVYGSQGNRDKYLSFRTWLSLSPHKDFRTCAHPRFQEENQLAESFKNLPASLIGSLICLRVTSLIFAFFLIKISAENIQTKRMMRVQIYLDIFKLGKCNNPIAQK